MSHIVIVGAGECGARAAFALREKGFGGEITLIGTEPHLPYERPPLSKDGLAGTEPPRLVADAGRYEEAGITVLTNVSVESIDRRHKAVRLGDDRAIRYDRLGEARAEYRLAPNPSFAAYGPTSLREFIALHRTS